MTDNRDIPEEWSFEAGSRALEGDASSEARILDSMTLLSAFHSDREAEVVGLLAGAMKEGRTLKIREEAAFNLVLMMSPLASAVLRDALPDLDDETRRSVEWMVHTKRGRTISFLGSFGKDDVGKLRVRRDRGMAKLGDKAKKRQTKLVKRLLWDEFRGDRLATQPLVTPDIAVGGIGYRAEFVPMNPGAAKFVLWVGAQGLRCAVGEREASITREIGTRLGWGFWGLGVNSYAHSIRAGKVTEYVSPDQRASLVRLPLGGNEFDDLRTSSEVPVFDQLVESWTRFE